MNGAHLHLIVNHFPIIGLFFGFGILISGLILKNKSIINTAYFLFIVSAIFAAFSMGTGEGAEELVEDMPNIGHHVIHEHEEFAEKLAILLYALGTLSIYGIYLSLKNHTRAAMVSIIALIVSALGIFLAIKTGTTGGEIRHTEIRANAVQSAGVEQSANGSEQGESVDND